MIINGLNYIDFLSEIRNIGGEFFWIKKNNLEELQNAGRSPKAIANAIFSSERIKKAIADEITKQRITEKLVRVEALKILSNMTSDFHLHSAVQPIGYLLVKIFRQIFSHIWFNSKSLERIRDLSSDRSVPIIWLPTHKSYLDFLLISLLCYHHQIQLPTICAAEDFQSSKIIGEALRRCGAFFIRRKFKDDPLYLAIFAEYVHQHLLNFDRSIEFFIEGQRSRTGKSVFPHTGLLQLVIEPFLQARVYDTIFVPITINYDRILEESLFSYELLGQPKPKENASSLFKARQILNDSFGDIFITIGEPISLREYSQFCSHSNNNEDFRVELRKSVNHESYKKNMREMSEKLAFKIITDQNNNNVLNIWTFMALAILQIINSNHKCKKISLKELISIVQMLVKIYNKCFKEKEICQKGLTLYDDIIYYLHFYESYINFNANTNIIELKNVHLGSSTEYLNLPTIILLSNYSSIAVYSLAPFCLFAISKNNNNLTLSSYEKYTFLCRLLSREFVFDFSQLSKQFEYVKSTLELLSKADCRLLVHIIMPYLIGYYNIFELFLEMNNEEKFSTKTELMNTIQQKLKLKINIKTNKLPLQIASIDLVKNAFNFLKFEKLIQENNHFIFNFVGITRVWKLLGELLKQDFQAFILGSLLNSKI